MKKILPLALALIAILACKQESEPLPGPDELLDSDQIQAIAYGGFRNRDRSKAPSLAEIKEDMHLLHAMNLRFVRTYHARLHDHTPRVLQAIRELKQEDPDFEMYLMLGCWMQCEDAFGDAPDHSRGDSVNNWAEIEQAVKLTREYPDIVRVIAVGNEAMVRWAASYYVQPEVILEGVEYLQELKRQEQLPEVWITSSDNYASWGGESAYHTEGLEKLIAAVDYLSVHSYPFHDTHYNPDWWYVPVDQEGLPKQEQIEAAMNRAVQRVETQLGQVEDYLRSLSSRKEIHIGETGWASSDSKLYGDNGSMAADPYKQYLYYRKIRDWSDSAGMSCFYFEAFDEPWKDDQDSGGSENHFGLFNVKGQAKLSVGERFTADSMAITGRNDQGVKPAYSIPIGDFMESSRRPTLRSEIPLKEISYPDASGSDPAAAEKLVILGASAAHSKASYPTSSLKIEAWDGSCEAYLDTNSTLQVNPGAGDWWGLALQMSAGAMKLQNWESGHLTLQIKGSYQQDFQLGLISGDYAEGTERKATWATQNISGFELSEEWQQLKLPLAQVSKQIDLEDVRALFYIQGVQPHQQGGIQIKDIALVR